MLLTIVDPAGMLFSPNEGKGMVGMVFVVIAVFYFTKAIE
jgi:hypothetical protein